MRFDGTTNITRQFRFKAMIFAWWETVWYVQSRYAVLRNKLISHALGCNCKSKNIILIPKYFCVCYTVTVTGMHKRNCEGFKKVRKHYSLHKIVLYYAAVTARSFLPQV